MGVYVDLIVIEIDRLNHLSCLMYSFVDFLLQKMTVDAVLFSYSLVDNILALAYQL